MKFVVDRETFLKPLQTVQGVVERRQTLPILSNVLISSQDGELAMCATDMEVELRSRTTLERVENGEVTVPARKLMDICRSLPPEAQVEFATRDGRATLRSGRSRFTLSTLPAADFPGGEDAEAEVEVRLRAAALKRLIDLTAFSMAHQDVRYYLNGLLLEIGGKNLRAVATDGHRLAVAELELETGVEGEPWQIIVPRKGVGELGRLLGSGDEEVALALGANWVRASLPELRLSSKLIDGRFPDYERVIPRREDCDKQVTVDREALRQALARTAILSNEKYRAVRLSLEPGVLRLVANNPEQEEAEEEVDVEYEGEGLEIGFNVSYLIDALSTLPSDTARLYLSDPGNSCLVEPVGASDCRYVVMPMRL